MIGLKIFFHSPPSSHRLSWLRFYSSVTPDSLPAGDDGDDDDNDDKDVDDDEDDDEEATFLERKKETL